MDADSNYVQLFRKSVATALRGNVETANVALLLKVGEGREIFEKFVSKLVATIKTCTHSISKVRIQLARERALKQFHQLRVEVLPPLWSDAFLQLGVPEENAVILQSINRLLFNSIVLKDFSQQYTTPTKGTHRISMCCDEENAVRYASGYVVKALKKHFEKKTGTKARQFFECLTNMSANSSYFDYTKTWMMLVNRGGLFEVNTDSFVFFRAIEVHVQETLCDHLLSGKMNKQEYISPLLQSEDIHHLWSKLDADIDTDSSEELLSAIVQKWVTLRGFAQVSSWVEDYKRASADTVKRKKALRKELAAAKSGNPRSEKKDVDDAGSSEKGEDEQRTKGKRKSLVSEEGSKLKHQRLDTGAASDKKTDRSYLRKLLSS